MLFEVHYYLHSDTKTILEAIKSMSQSIADFAEKYNAHVAAVSADLDEIKASIVALNVQIGVLQNSQGKLSDADQATLNAIEATGEDLQAKADSLAGHVPPVAPVEPQS